MNEPRLDSSGPGARQSQSSAETPNADSQLESDKNGRNEPQRRLLKQLLFSRHWLFIPPVALGIFVVYLMVSGKKELPRVPVPERSVKAKIVLAQLEDLKTEVVGYGTASPARSWSAVAEVSGRIQWITPVLESGNWVDEGEELLIIDKRDYQLRLEQRQADLDAAKASLAELEASQKADNKSLKIEQDLLSVSKKDVERVRKLRQQNAVSVSEVDSVEGNLLRQIQSVQLRKNTLSLYPSRIASAKAKVALAQSAVAESQRNVDRTVIKSPMNGVFADADLEIGQVVAPNQQLFQIQDSSRIEIEAQVSLSQLGQLISPSIEPAVNLKELANALSEVEALVINESGSRRYQWKGKPLRLTESLDVQTRTIGVVVEVVNPTGQANVDDNSSPAQRSIPLKSGTYCEVHLYGPIKKNVIALPRTSFDGETIYVVDEKNCLRGRQVVRGDSIGERIIVEYGVSSGDRVIRRPPIPAIEGMKVRSQ